MRRCIEIIGDGARAHTKALVDALPIGAVVTIEDEPPRSLKQNAMMWPLLTALSLQTVWRVNGLPCYMTPEDWKDVLTAAYRNEARRIAEGLDGGVVLLGARTRSFSVREFSEFLEFVHATAASFGVDLSRETA